MSRLHPGYTAWWAIVLAGALLAYLAGYATLTGLCLAIGAAVEIVAVRRKSPGDTLSEHVWAIIEDRPAMIPMAVGFGLWLVWTPLELLPAGRDLVARVGIDVGLWGLALGVLSWLVVHFAFRGRYG